VVDNEVVLAIYLTGAMLVACGVYAAGRRLCDRRSPATHPLIVSMLAGVVWPLLVIGLVELSAVVGFTKIQSKPGPGVGIFA